MKKQFNRMRQLANQTVGRAVRPSGAENTQCVNILSFPDADESTHVHERRYEATKSKHYSTLMVCRSRR
ncbi:hypothetical protein KUCAC02_027728 [Chaenocephalus aceratus]|uniref:Uncharacterized protein n=1 Tax=Chaenocephalus aceratus TaxID=36190 RepID=A0ACB9W4F0_CHAAC|nr:hypothetical protein KUCAC02_027728 [Chaenocephalus aceratus]